MAIVKAHTDRPSTNPVSYIFNLKKGGRATRVGELTIPHGDLKRFLGKSLDILAKVLIQVKR